MKKIVSILAMFSVLLSASLCYSVDRYHNRTLRPPCYEENLGVFYVEYLFGFEPNEIVCGEWYFDGEPALAPYADIEQGFYCRSADENGMAMFAYRLTGDYTCLDAYQLLKFRIMEY